MKALGPRDSALYDSLSVNSVNTLEEMTMRVKSYIDLEMAKEGRKMHKKLKKKVQEGNRPEQCPSKEGQDDH